VLTGKLSSVDENNVEVFNETTSEVVVVLVGEP
jgi:hypothetical protein